MNSDVNCPDLSLDEDDLPVGSGVVLSPLRVARESEMPRSDAHHLVAGLLALEAKAESLERNLAEQQEQLRDLDESLTTGLLEAERGSQSAASELITLELKIKSLARHLTKQQKLVQDLDKSVGVGLAEAERDRYTIASKLIALEAKLQSLGRDVAEQQDLLRDHDKVLVRRISAAERERQGTAAQLLEAAQIQRREVKAGFGRLATTTGAALVLIVVFAGVLAFLGYRDLKQAQKPLREEVAAIKNELDRRADALRVDDALTQGFERLNERVNEISSSLERMGQALANNREADGGAVDRAADASAPDATTAAVDGVQDEQRRLLGAPEVSRGQKPVASREAPSTTNDPKAAPQGRPGADIPSEFVGTDTGAQLDSPSVKGMAVEMEAVGSDVEAPDPSAQTDGANGSLEAARRVDAEQQQLLEELESSPPQEAAASLEEAPQTSDATTVTEIVPVTDVPPEVGDIDAGASPDTPPGEPKTGESDTVLGESDAASVEPAEATLVNVPAAGDRAYALQLIGFFSRDSLQTFARREDLPERMYYLEEKHRRRPWFALIHSLHADYASAQETISRLAPDLIAMEPWIRPLRGSEELLLLKPGEAPQEVYETRNGETAAPSNGGASVPFETAAKPD